MKKRTQKKMYTIVGAILLVLAGVTVAYAALSSVLNVTVNKITMTNSVPFDVHFKSESVSGAASNSVTGTTSGIVCGTATSGNQDVSVADITLNLPGDTCKYTLTIQNGGSVGAILTAIAKKGSESACGAISGSSYTCGNITYKLSTDSTGNTALATNSTIAAGGNQVVYLTITHNDHAASGLVGTTTSYSNMGFTLTYTQQ